MLIPIKTFYCGGLPEKKDLIEAKQLCIEENCTVELRWMPNILVGWYYLFIKADSDIEKMWEDQVPKVYGW